MPIEVEFVDVCFRYANGSEILKNISFKLKSGEKLALVGENGSGKSTLIKLFCGLYAPSKGKILINGIDMKHIHLSAWRKHVAPVFQDFYDFHFTIEKNITLSTDTTDKNRLRLVSDKTGISNLLNNANQKLGKIFGGNELSGGQWQKLAIARALYKDAEIYILDEPTASLDPLAEYDIYKQFETICANKTVLFITHRLSSIIMADRVLLLDKGKLIAEGFHEALMKRSLLYKKMFTAQSANYFKLGEFI